MDHWIDTISKAFLRDTPRRTLLQLTSLVVTNLDLGVVPAAVARRRNTRKGKGKGKNNAKHNRKSNGKVKNRDRATPNELTDWSRTCSGGACFTAWPSGSRYDLDNRSYCEFICEQCDGDDPRQFCLLGGPASPIGADCCDAGLTCCGYACVQFGTPDHCTGCNEPCRGEGRKCCGNPVIPDCVDTRSSRRHCGDCGQLCLHPDMACCDGSCQDTLFNDAHCGGCNPCPSGWECCHGRCIESASASCCRDHPRWIGVCPAPSLCCLLSNGEPGCCNP
jgi:hypothetical protein